MKLISSIFFICLCFISQAQTRLPLSEAIQKSLAQNFGILVEKQNIEFARVNNDWGQAGRFPSINFNIGQNNQFNNVDNPAAFAQGITVNNIITPAVNLNWVLFDGFRVKITKQRLEQLEKLAQGNSQVVVENTVQATINAYYSAVLARERLKIQEKNLFLSREKYEYVIFKENVGSAVTSDILLEKNNYLSDSSAWINQKLLLRNAFRALNEIMAEQDMTKTYELTDNLLFDDQNFSLQDLENKTFESNSNLKAQALNQDILKNTVSLNKSDYYPLISFNLNTSYTTNKQDLSRARFAGGTTRENNVAKTISIFGNFTLSVPLFNGGQIRRAVQTATIQEKAGNLRLESLKLTLKRNLADAFDLYNVRRDLAKIAIENRTAAETNLQLSEDKFKQGTLNAFDYRLLQNAYRDAAFAELQAFFAFLDAKTTLLRLTGGIVK